MINKEFKNLKFRRTYIDGSKKKEQKKFNDVQKIDSDNSEYNLFEYRRILTHYINDKLNIIFSWRYVTGKLVIILLPLTLLMSIINFNFAVIILILNFILYIINEIIKHNEKKMLLNYDFSLIILLNEIKKQTGFDL